MELFEQASKLKVRFASNRGTLTVEDLWDCPLQGSALSLEDIAQRVHAVLEATTTKSFVSAAPVADKELQVKMDVVKHIIAYKLAVAERNEKAAATRSRNERIRAIIAKKKDAALEDTDVADLEAMLEDPDSSTLSA